MEGRKNPMESTRLPVSERFEELYGVKLIPVAYKDLPDNVREHLELMSAKSVDENSHRVENFLHVYAVAHMNEDVTFIGEQDKQYSEDNRVERTVYFVDTREGLITGFLELRYNIGPTGFSKDKPYVGYTETCLGFEKKGLARRRLEVANAFSVAAYGNVLYSDTIMTEYAQRIWQRLVSDGQAEIYNPVRYRFRPKYPGFSGLGS